jgi:hypothetical protein
MKKIIARSARIAASVCAVASLAVILGYTERSSAQQVSPTTTPAVKAPPAPSYASYWPAGTPTPEDTIRRLMQAYAAGEMTAAQAKYTTATGRQVIEWLVTQKWFAEKLATVVTKESTLVVLDRRWGGNRFEVVCLFNGKDGGTTVSAIFFLQDGAMKFHDLFLSRLRGDRHDIFLSSVMNDPGWVRANFGGTKPGEPPGAPARGIGGAIQDAGHLVKDTSTLVWAIRNLLKLLPLL